MAERARSRHQPRADSIPQAPAELPARRLVSREYLNWQLPDDDTPLN